MRPDFSCVTRFENRSASMSTGYTVMCPPGVALPYKSGRTRIKKQDSNIRSTDRAAANDSDVPSAWLFDLATDAGYSTSFAEDVCYHFSGRCQRRFSSQDNFYDTASVYQHSKFSSAFCAVKKARNGRDGDHEEHRIEYELLLEYIAKVFAAGPRSLPKFSLVNVGAGHDYRYLPFRHSHIQELDGALTGMLCKLLGDPTSSNTVVVLWADHGILDSGLISTMSRVFHTLVPPQTCQARCYS